MWCRQFVQLTARSCESSSSRKMESKLWLNLRTLSVQLERSSLSMVPYHRTLIPLLSTNSIFNRIGISFSTHICNTPTANYNFPPNFCFYSHLQTLFLEYSSQNKYRHHWETMIWVKIQFSDMRETQFANMSKKKCSLLIGMKIELLCGWK
jgi:hypothetical protein